MSTIHEKEHEMMLASEVARILGCSRQLVVLLFDRGKLRGRRTPGGTRLIDRASVEALALERRERQEAERS